MKALANTIVFIIATVSVLTASTYPTSATINIADINVTVDRVDSNRDNAEVADRDNSGTPRPSNFALVPQAIKKQALTRRACLQAESSGHGSNFFFAPLILYRHSYLLCRRRITSSPPRLKIASELGSGTKAICMKPEDSPPPLLDKLVLSEASKFSW